MNPRMHPVIASVILGVSLLSQPVEAARYTLDPTHTFIEFRAKHLGYSWLYGRFNRIEGKLTWDESRPHASRISVTIDMDSLDSNHAERDKHLRSDDYLDVHTYPEATFVSERYEGDADKGTLHGVLTLHGVEKALSIPVRRIGEGHDPWGGYRVGFEGQITLDAFDFGMDYDVGPDGNLIELFLGIEGVRQKKLAPKRR